MSLLRRRAMYGGGELPVGYKRCQYLHKKGVSSYIDTGIIPDYDMSLDVKFSFTASSITKYIYGSDDAYNYGFSCNIDTRTNDGLRICVFFKNWMVFTKVNPQIGAQYSLSVSGNKAVLNGKEFYYNHGLYVCKHSMILFGTKRKGNVLATPGYCDELKIYSFSMSKNGKQIQNLIPALDPNDTPCMYDTVSKQTFYNSGTGEFLYELA